MQNDLNSKEKEYREWLKTHSLPLPSEEQAQWLEMEIGMFSHFGLNTYYNKEWSDGSLDPIKFNPKKLDCNQWVQVAKDLGAKYHIMTAKHHDGFCLWPTETTEYSVKNSPYKNGNGDIIYEFLEACKKGGIRAGLYLSPWDRHEKCYSDKKAYDEFYLRQLKELLTWYEWDPVELWFDGAGSQGREYDWVSIMKLIKEHAPHAIIFNMGTPSIRWCGNESGYAPYPHWYVVSKENATDFSNGKIITDGFGDYFLPAECDTPIRKALWFYHPYSRIMLRSKKKLIDIYEKSVGRGANLLLNIAPNREGLFEPSDIKRALWLGQEIKKRYGNPIKSTSGTGESFEIELESEQLITASIIQEDIRQGQRVRSYIIEALPGGNDGNYKEVIVGSSIGHKKIDRFKPIRAKKIRLRITNLLFTPIIKNFSIFT